MASDSVHHIAVTAEEVFSSQIGGRFFFVPGSPKRAKQIAENFEDVKAFPSQRGYDVFTGRLRFGKRSVDVGSVCTGMGCPSLDIIVNELMVLGISRFLRIGTAGSLRPEKIHSGDTVIATGAVRDESTSSAYASPSVPSIPSFVLTECIIKTAQKMDLSFNVHAGLVHTKDAFFAREHKIGPLSEFNQEYMAHLKQLGVLATEMESSHLFMLAQMHTGEDVRVCRQALFQQKFLAGSILAIVGDERQFTSEEIHVAAVNQAISIGLKSVETLYSYDDN
jgi:uridine phosphorylase